MDIKNFVLSYYKNSREDFHIHKVEKTYEAQKPHTHEYFQIYYITKGSLVHYVEENCAELEHGDMFIIPPGVMHHISLKPNTVFYSISFMADFLYGENKLAKNFLSSLQNESGGHIKPKISIHSKEAFYIENIMEHISQEFGEKPFAHSEMIKTYTGLLVTMLARSYFENATTDVSVHFENNKQFVMHSIEYIKENFADNITLDEISKKSAMSKNKFCSTFLSLTGYSFNTFLNMCRIKKAAEYIKQGYKITAIFGLCGYNDFSTFYRNFKKIMGITPQQYKKIHSD